MKKKILVLVVVLLLVTSTIQVAFAHHDPKPSPPPNRNGGSCNMDHSVWQDEDGNWMWTGPGNANGAQVTKVVDPDTGEIIYEFQQRGMVHVHTKISPAKIFPDGYTYGATNMDLIGTRHGCGE